MSSELILKNAVVKSVKDGFFRPGGYYGVRYLKIVVEDPKHGAVYFSSSSKALGKISRGDTISCYLTQTGQGQPSEKYPVPIKFAKKARRIEVKRIETPNCTLTQVYSV